MLSIIHSGFNVISRHLYCTNLCETPFTLKRTEASLNLSLHCLTSALKNSSPSTSFQNPSLLKICSQRRMRKQHFLYQSLYSEFDFTSEKYLSNSASGLYLLNLRSSFSGFHPEYFSLKLLTLVVL